MTDKELTLQDIYELMEYDNYEFQTQDVKTALLMLRKRMDKEAKELNTGEPVVWIFGCHLDSAKKMPHLCRVTPTQEHEGYIPLYSQDYINQLLGEIAELKHINKNWQISEGQLLGEIEALKQRLYKDNVKPVINATTTSIR